MKRIISFMVILVSFSFNAYAFHTPRKIIDDIMVTLTEATPQFLRVQSENNKLIFKVNYKDFNKYLQKFASSNKYVTKIKANTNSSGDIFELSASFIETDIKNLSRQVLLNIKYIIEVEQNKVRILIGKVYVDSFTVPLSLMSQ